MMRVYGLDLDTAMAARAMSPAMLADLAVNLPDGSQLWRAMDTPNAWSVTDHLLATLADQMNLWMWANADRRRRGPRPDPLPRPGGGAGHAGGKPHGKADAGDGGNATRPRSRTVRGEPMDAAAFLAFRAHRFHDTGRTENRPLADPGDTM